MTLEGQSSTRPGTITACAVLLCVAWAVASVVTFVVVSGIPDRLSVLRSLDDDAAALRLQLKGAVALALLLAAGALFAYAIPRLLRGLHAARVSLWVGVPLLAIDHRWLRCGCG